MVRDRSQLFCLAASLVAMLPSNLSRADQKTDSLKATAAMEGKVEVQWLQPLAPETGVEASLHQQGEPKPLSELDMRYAYCYAFFRAPPAGEEAKSLVQKIFDDLTSFKGLSGRAFLELAYPSSVSALRCARPRSADQPGEQSLTFGEIRDTVGRKKIDEFRKSG
jgi:hypothetical protein